MSRKHQISQLASLVRRYRKLDATRPGIPSAVAKYLTDPGVPTLFNPLVLKVAASAPEWAKDSSSLEHHLGAGDGTWFHSFAFDNGAAVPGRDPSFRKLMALQLPPSLNGHTLLDVGAYEGYFSFHAAQLGAQVTANDHFVWNWPNDPSRAHFEAVGQVVGLPFETLDAEVTALPGLTRKWDVVLFLGVLYHLEDPIGALRCIRAVTSGMVILETLVDRLDSPEPSAAVYSGLNQDASNNFGPNLAAVAALAAKAGFRHTDFRGIWEINTVASLSGLPSISPVTSGRAVFYLYP